MHQSPLPVLLITRSRICMTRLSTSKNLYFYRPRCGASIVHKGVTCFCFSSLTSSRMQMHCETKVRSVLKHRQCHLYDNEEYNQNPATILQHSRLGSYSQLCGFLSCTWQMKDISVGRAWRCSTMFADVRRLKGKTS